ncbi:unnamed protein product [Leuciscus chuanchicus]
MSEDKSSRFVPRCSSWRREALGARQRVYDGNRQLQREIAFSLIYGQRFEPGVRVARDGGWDMCGPAFEVTCDSGGSSALVVEDVTMPVTEATRAAACEVHGEARFSWDQLGREVTCQKITSVNNRFASIKVSTKCNDVVEMYKPEIWLVGAYVRRFYEQRSRSGVAGANRAGLAVTGASSAHATEA